jgi:carbonic anhydrase/acetyltransferase-like protein (isoleucine patch superfamily)
MPPGSESLESRIDLHPDAWVAPTAVLKGRVTVGANVSIWYGCVLRGDLEPIAIGDETNVQDGSIVHVDRGFPATVGRRVTIGHRAVVHGCHVDDEAVIGMGAVVLSGSRIGRGALVAAGALVREGFTVPPAAIAAGVPARIVGTVGPELIERFRLGVDGYMELARAYRSAS